MKQIYQFERHSPPPLNEALLRAEAHRRQLRRQTALLAMAGVLMQACMALSALLLYAVSPLLSLLCAVYLVVSVTGSSVILLIFAPKRRILIHE